jgi:zinc transport system permease protein
VVFDEEFARLRGVPVEFFYLLLLVLVAVTVVLLIQVVGLILVLAC